MLRIWQSPVTRPTMDIDLLAQTSNDLEAIIDIFRKICLIDCEEDGLLFDGGSLQVVRIKEDARYEGVRLTFKAWLSKARVPMQVDIGFDDVIYSKKELLKLTSILPLPVTSMNCYSRESVIAEKFEAMSSLGFLNSRMKDFYDIWLLSSSFTFDGQLLAEAIRKTFEHRDTDISSTPTAFSDAFVDEGNVQWKAFRRKLKEDESPELFASVVQQCRTFLRPLTEGILSEEKFMKKWPANGPWED